MRTAKSITAGPVVRQASVRVAEFWLYLILRSAGAWPGVFWTRASAALARLDRRYGFQVLGLLLRLFVDAGDGEPGRTLRPCRRPRAPVRRRASGPMTKTVAARTIAPPQVMKLARPLVMSTGRPFSFSGSFGYGMEGI